MSFVFTKAKRENVPLLIGMIGGTGSGKTLSAMKLAKGLSGGKRFAVIDTEAGRAKHYADDFDFDHGDLHAPFRPQSYVEAIQAADAAGYPAIVVDSMSHVWAGDGGVLDWQEDELERMAGQDWKKREACKIAAWIKPKQAHKQMMQKLLQVRAHLILCFRAEQKIEMVKDDHGKWQIQPKQSATGREGWIPICEKNVPFELTASFLLTADAPGFPKPIKLESQHHAMFPLNQPIGDEAGRALAAWSAGASAEPTGPLHVGRIEAAKGTAALSAWWSTLSKAQKASLKSALDGELKDAASKADIANKDAGQKIEARNATKEGSPVTQLILADRLRTVTSLTGVDRIRADIPNLPTDAQEVMRLACDARAEEIGECLP